MNHAKHILFVWISGALLMGLLFAQREWTLPPFILMGLVLVGLFFIVAKRNAAQKGVEQAKALVLLCLVGAVGYGLGWTARNSGEAYVPVREARTVGGRVEVSGQVKKSEKGYRFLGNLVEENGARSHVMIYSPLQGEIPLPGYSYSFEGKLKCLPENPAGYREYLQKEKAVGILVAGKWEDPSPVGGLEAFFQRSQHFMGSQMEALMPDSQVAGIAKAMFLGDRSGLQMETREVFRLTGLSHILAISGLHILLLFQMLNQALAPMVRRPWQNKGRKWILLGVIFGYCLLSGGSPSVMRAGWMVGLGLIAELMGWRIQRLNLVAFTAFIQMVWDPNVVSDIGFQLSYAAVLGILIVARPLQAMGRRYSPKAPKFLVESLSVTLAAQLFTGPLIWIHFSTFPAWFLVANLLVLPLADIATKVGFLALFLCWIPGINTALFGMLDFCLWAMGWVSTQVAHLPAPTIERWSPFESGVWILVLTLSPVLWLIWRASRRRLPKFGKMAPSW